MTAVITTMEITLAKQLWTMWLMYTILMLKILSPVKINVTCLMTAISGPFLMYQMLPNLITNAFYSENAISMNHAKHVKQDQKANTILEDKQTKKTQPLERRAAFACPQKPNNLTSF